MGKLIGGAETFTTSDGGTRTLGDGTKVSYSADCLGSEGHNSYYSLKTDSVAGWTNPCK